MLRSSNGLGHWRGLGIWVRIPYEGNDCLDECIRYPIVNLVWQTTARCEGVNEFSRGYVMLTSHCLVHSSKQFVGEYEIQYIWFTAIWYNVSRVSTQR
jgi:hypothetical protein